MTSQRTGAYLEPRHRAIALVIVVATVELVSVLLAGAGGAEGHSSAVSTAGLDSSPLASESAPLQAASNSLAQGGGPADGVPTSCSATGSDPDAAQCSAEPSSPTLTAQTGTTPSWSELTTSIPTARAGASMVYDAKDKYVVLFGGYGPTSRSGLLKGTWTFANGIWTKLTPTKSPPSREYATMAYDAADGYVVLYGGQNETATLTDTWKFVGGEWTKLTPTENPGVLESPGSMVYDAKDGYVLLLGAASVKGVETSETWKFVGGQWTQLAPTVSPSPRSDEFMDYDAADGYVLLFGGFNASTFAYLGDTWTYTGGAWTLLSPASSPSPRYGGGMAYDAIDKEVVLYGGVTTGVTFSSDTWTFKAGAWTQISTEASPGRRASFTMADGTSTVPILLFGGGNSGSALLDSNWTFRGLVWTHVTLKSPGTLEGPSMVYDEKDGYVLEFGGDVAGTFGSVLSNETWKFSGGAWTQLHPEISPPARAFAGIAYDQSDGYVLLFGGEGVYGDLSDTWTFVGGQWAEVSTGSDHPPQLQSPAMTYDFADDYVVLFGGYNSTSAVVFAQTWTYSGGFWSPLSPSPSPSARWGAQMTYDSEDGYVLLFSGSVAFAQNIEYADTWTFSAGVWTNVTTSLGGSPDPTSSGGLADDTYFQYPVLVGGAGQFGLSNETWIYTGSTWTLLNTPTSPGQVFDMGLAFDPSENSLVMFGGYYLFVGASSETWLF